MDTDVDVHGRAANPTGPALPPESSTATRLGLWLFGGGTFAIGAAYAGALAGGGAAAWTSWALVIGASANTVGLLVLGVARQRVKSRVVAVSLGVISAILIGAFATALSLPATEGAGGALFGGLPVRLAVLFYAIGFAPLFALPIVFGLTFDPRSADETAAAE